jgi:hypothetical protein
VTGKKKRRKSRHRAPVKSALLDAFTERDLEVWETRSIDLQSYHDRVYYDLERQRAARYEELCVAPVPNAAFSRLLMSPGNSCWLLRGVGGRSRQPFGILRVLREP